MVTFCSCCGASLPLADVVLREGREEAHPSYKCPTCGEQAAPDAAQPETEDGLNGGHEIRIKDGSWETE